MFTKSITVKAAIVVVAAFAAHGLTAVSASTPGQSASPRSAPLIPDADQRVPVQATDGAVVTVRFGDLDLTGAEGARAMLRRIDNAARQVCAGEAPCARQAAATAIASLSSPQVAVLASARD